MQATSCTTLIPWLARALYSRIKRPGREAVHFHLSRMVHLFLHSSIRLHGMVLNYLSTGTTSPLSVAGVVFLNSISELHIREVLVADLGLVVSTCTVPCYIKH
jgi:hypothetical protein